MAEKDLTNIKGIGQKTADKLQSAGFEDIESIAAASSEELKKIEGITKKRAHNYIRRSQNILNSQNSRESNVQKDNFLVGIGIILLGAILVGSAIFLLPEIAGDKLLEDPGPGFTQIGLVGTGESSMIIGTQCRQAEIPITDDQAFSISSGENGFIRPLHHDTMKNIMDHYDIEPIYFKIDREVGENDDILAGTLRLKRGKNVLDLDIRPSDGMGLVARYDMPVYMKNSLFEEWTENVC